MQGLEYVESILCKEVRPQTGKKIFLDKFRKQIRQDICLRLEILIQKGHSLNKQNFLEEGKKNDFFSYM